MLTPARRFISRFCAVVRRRRQDDEFDDELAAHVAMATDDYMKRGLSAEQARRAALLRLGGHASLKDQHREVRGMPIIETTWQDVRLAIRMLVRSPWFSLTAITALTLGIGANAAIFSAVDSVLLEPLPYQEPQQLVGVWEEPAPGTRKSVSPGVFRDWRDHSTSFESLSVVAPEDANLTGDGRPERVRGLRVSASYLDILRLRPALGLGFGRTDDQAGHDNKVVILSHGLWQRRFGGDPGILGRRIDVNLESHTVAGVLPRAPSLPDPDVELLRPYVLTDDPSHTTRKNHLFFVIGRLRGEVDVARAQAELSALKQQLNPVYPAAKRDWDYLVAPMQEQLVGDTRRTLMTLMGAVGFVLLIACATVANLLLARAASRGTEMGIRSALGGSRWRIVRQTLTESTVLSVIGGGLGLTLAFLGIRLLNRLDPTLLPRAHEIGMDWRVLAFAVVISLATGLTFGLAPAIQAARGDLNVRLNGAGRSRVDGATTLRSGLVIAEIALSLVLLTGAALLLQSLLHLVHVPPGFDPRNALAMEVYLPKERYSTGDDGARFFHAVFERLEALPGVEAVGMATTLPMAGPDYGTRIEAEGIRPPDGGHHVRWEFVAGEYFRAMGIPSIRGRSFTRRDNSTEAPRTAVINDTLARIVFAGTNPLGRRIRFWGEMWQVIGVVGSVRQTDLATSPSPRIYLPQAFNFIWNGGAVIVRSTRDARALAQAVTQEIVTIDSQQPIANVRTLAEVVSTSMAKLRLTVALIGALAGTAVLLTAIGLFGIMAYTVQRRVPELGLRVALGAQHADILTLVMRRGVGLTLTGIAVGTTASLRFAGVLASELHGVTSTDAPTYAVTGLLLLAVALVACWLPARRATHVDPLVALRTT